MIPYEELVAALDRYVTRNGGTPQSVYARAPMGAPAAPAAEAYAPSAHEPAAVVYDEPHDPDLAPSLGEHGDEDATHVGALPGEAAPQPLQPVVDEGSNEIDLGDVLSDEEL